MIKLKYFVPNGVEKTWEPKGAKHVQMLDFEYKRKIKMVISFSVTRDLVPPCIVSTSIISKAFPTNNQRETNGINERWDFTFGENHIGCTWK